MQLNKPGWTVAQKRDSALLIATVVLATQFRAEFKQSDFIIPSLLVSHLISFCFMSTKLFVLNLF